MGSRATPRRSDRADTIAAVVAAVLTALVAAGLFVWVVSRTTSSGETATGATQVESQIDESPIPPSTDPPVSTDTAADRAAYCDAAIAALALSPIPLERAPVDAQLLARLAAYAAVLDELVVVAAPLEIADTTAAASDAYVAWLAAVEADPDDPAVLDRDAVRSAEQQAVESLDVVAGFTSDFCA